MNIFQAELKKYFSWKLIAASLLLFLIFWVLYLEYYSNHATRSDDIGRAYRLQTEIYKKVGPVVTPEKEADLMAISKDAEKELNQLIKQNKPLKTFGVTTYQAAKKRLAAISEAKEAQKQSGQSFTEAWEAFVFSDPKIYDLNYKITFLNTSDPNKGAAEGLNEPDSKVGKGYSSVIFDVAQRDGAYLRYVGIFIMMVTLIWGAPLIFMDDLRKVRPLQLVSQTGRSILKQQTRAIQVGGFLLMATITLLTLGYLIIANQSYIFFGSSTEGFGNSFPTYVNITYGTYLLLAVLSFSLITLLANNIACIISLESKSMAQLAGGLIISIAGLNMITSAVLKFFLTFQNPLYKFIPIPFIELIFLGILGLISSLCLRLFIKKNAGEQV